MQINAKPLLGRISRGNSSCRTAVSQWVGYQRHKLFTRCLEDGLRLFLYAIVVQHAEPLMLNLFLEDKYG